MNPLRFLVIATLGLTATPGYAVPILFSLETEPFTAWQAAANDSSGVLSFTAFGDTDDAGTASYLIDVEPGGGTAHGMAPGFGQQVRFIVTVQPVGVQSIPFLTSGAGDSLIVHFNGIVSRFSQGQRVTVTDGMIAGFDGLVLENPGILTAIDLLAFDVPSLPKFTGEAEVGGLLTAQVVPEPSTDALAVLALAVMVASRPRQNPVPSANVIDKKVQQASSRPN